MRTLLLCAISVILLVQGPNVVNAGPRDAQWKKVDEAIKKGLPKSAIELLDPIEKAALKEKAFPEAVKALAMKIALRGNIEGNKPEERIVRLEAALDAAPEGTRPILQSLLASWYWSYFEINRWRFMQRTATTAPPGKDFTTWDLPRLFAEIDKHFSAALATPEALAKVPVTDWDALLVKGSYPDSYRPTLLDFIAAQALEFYGAGEQAGARAENAFDLLASSPIFAESAEFQSWKPETTDNDSNLLKGIRLLQQLLAAHANDDDRTAWLDLELARLRFGFNHAVGEEKSPRYRQALRQFIARWGDHEVSAMARFQLASELQVEEPLEARELGQEAINAFPISPGADQCRMLVAQIEHPECQIFTERVWNQPNAGIQVQYKNLTKIYFRLYRADWTGRLKPRRYRPEELDDEMKQFLARRPDYQWSSNLEATDDFRQRDQQVAVPAELKPGFYFLISSHNEKFQENNNLIQVTDVWVSTLALVSTLQTGSERIRGFVLDANSGEPIAGAEVQIYYRPNNNQNVEPGPKVATDGNGQFALPGKQHQRGQIVVRYKDQQLAGAQDYHVFPQGDAVEHQQTIFFTDRSIYRPGQTIQFKGICIAAQYEKDNYETLKQQSLTVIFSDANNQEVARQQVQSNDYGSVSGSFIAPRGRLLGQMSIRVEGGPAGQAYFSVEEYKRPKFQVTVDPPKESPRLNDVVKVHGKAIGYTGAAIDGAKVRYRVVRQVQYPIWWSWFYSWRQPPGGSQGSQEIARGATVTKSDGSLEFEFTARPDLSVAESDEPVFQYSIHVDVTDNAGETRSTDRVVRVGYAALAAELSAGQYLTVDEPIEVAVVTQSLDGEGQTADVQLRLHRLKEPEKVTRPRLLPGSIAAGTRPARKPGERDPGDKEPPFDPADPNTWPLGELIEEHGLTTDGAGKAKLAVKLPAGLYRIVLETKDRFGKKVTSRLPVHVIDPSSKTLTARIPHHVAARSWSVEPGQDFVAIWGSGYDRARAFVEVEHRRKVIQAYWTEAGATQQPLRMPVAESHRGGFTVRITMVRENRGYITQQRVDVPWSNKELRVRWEHFVSKLEPAQKETWTATISGPDAQQAVAEMVAALYDESLDAFRPHDWPTGFGVFRQDYSQIHLHFDNYAKNLQQMLGGFPLNAQGQNWYYRQFPPELQSSIWFDGGHPLVKFSPGGFGGPPGAPAAEMGGGGGGGGRLGRRSNRELANSALAEGEANFDMAVVGGDLTLGDEGGGAKSPNAGTVNPRRNLQETAFFFPHLLADKQGNVRLEFTMPETLTKWKFLGFAHDRQLRGGLLRDSVVTARELMIQPNPPRFLRESDQLEFSVKVSNQSPTTQKGTVRITFADARTGKSVDDLLGNKELELPFEIPSLESRGFSWKLNVPDGLGPITYKAVGSTGRLADGEEGTIPVLSRRVLVTESLPLPLRGKQKRSFVFDKLRDSAQSDSLKHESLTVQMVSNPSWYAVMALPYLMEYPHECSEQVFNRLYANLLARHIAASDPKIRQVFEQWKGTPALDSPLEKNQDLKSVVLEETPWVRAAQGESQARRNVGILFDENRLNDETTRNFSKLAQMQYEDGAWPWFPGGPGNDYITLYVTTGFGRLRHLGVQLDVSPAIKSLERLDGWITEQYKRIKNKDENHLTTTIAFYLYGRSFFLEDKPVGPEHREAVDYYLNQARKHWLALGHRQSQGHLALALKRFGDLEAGKGIVRSLKERSVSNEELGMFWRDTEHSWWWYRAPIETQAVMIEALDEVLSDMESVEDCKVWLLKQKQTQDWKTTKGTADAIYALLLRGSQLLASDALVEVTLGDTPITPKDVEAGTGFYEQKFLRNEVRPEFGKIEVTKTDAGVSWGSVHWQYLEDMRKVTPYEGTPLKLTKALFTKTATASGPKLVPVNGPIHVGDELVVRIELRTDRDMEFVHLKDYRGSGTEPTNVLSQYRFQDGLGYYESTRDTASHFFIDYLPKGVYVFEYSTRVAHRGEYQTGFAQIQCMYAPEFNSHSESHLLKVE